MQELKKKNLPENEYKRKTTLNYIENNLEINYAIPTEEININQEI